MKVAQRLSELLTHLGVHELFGNPGTTELPFLEGIRQRYYLTLHDGIAVGAADGASQVSRSLSVANLHAAPGLGNSVAFIDSARRNHSPVLVTVGQQDLRHLDQAPLLSGDFESMTRGLVKQFHEVRRPEELAASLEAAVHSALSPPMGPVLLSLPMNVMEQEAGGPDLSSETTVSLPEDPGPLVGRMRSATNPALVVGYEVDVYDAFAEVSELARALAAPVYAEPICSRAPVPEGLANFVSDLLPQSAAIASVLGAHDLVVLLGADLTLYPYSPSPTIPASRLAYVGSDPSVAKKLVCDHALGNLKGLLREILASLPPSNRTFRRAPDFARANRVARAAVRMGGEYVVDAVRRVFSGYTVVDESVSLIPTMKAVGFYRGKDSYFSSRSQQLGWGLAAAIGITLRIPKTVLVVGDGALQYSIPALWTLARYRIPTKVVVVNNGGYNILKSYSKANHPPLAAADFLEVPGLNVEEIAGGYGVESATVESPHRLDAALSKLRDQDGPGLLNVEIDRTIPDLFS